MEITRMMTIAENNNINIKQTDCGKIYLNYDNARIFFNKAAFLNFLIEIDDWCIRKEKDTNIELIVKACRFAMLVKDEDLKNFIKTVQEAAYNIIPILNEYRQLNSKSELFKSRVN